MATDARPHSPAKRFRAALTFDLHAEDQPRDISLCAESLAQARLKGTFFVPTGLIPKPGFAEALRELAACGHELGTHGHEHDGAEMAALRSGPAAALGFLRDSTLRFSEFFGKAPRVFRAPCWCRVGDDALDELTRLGYRVDSSATPQRIGLLSSFPFESPYLLSPRSPHFLRKTLLEIPTASFLIPAGAPTIETLRDLALLFTYALRLEATLIRSRVLVVQLHVGNLNAAGIANTYPPPSWDDLLPRAQGGIGARRWIRTSSRGTIARVARGIMDALAAGRLVTLEAVYEESVSSFPRLPAPVRHPIFQS